MYVLASIGDNTGAATPATSGFYVPVVSAITQPATDITPSEFRWMRIGDEVSLQGTITVDTNVGAPTFTSCELTLPFPPFGIVGMAVKTPASPVVGDEAYTFTCTDSGGGNLIVQGNMPANLGPWAFAITIAYRAI